MAESAAILTTRAPAAELERFINEQVESGRYRSAGEVVRDAVRLLQERSEIREAKLALLRNAVEKGIDELEGGEGTSAEEGFEEILADLDRSEAA